MTQFIPDLKPQATPQIPYFEDSQSEKIPGRGTTKSVAALQKEVRELLTKIGAYGVSFTAGQYPGKPVRYGFQIYFNFATAKGRIDCAALPMRKETSNKKDRALAQALYLLRDKLQAMLYSTVHEPGAIPLVPYLMDNNGKTVTEFLIETGNLPLLGSGKE